MHIFRTPNRYRILSIAGSLLLSSTLFSPATASDDPPPDAQFAATAVPTISTPPARLHVSEDVCRELSGSLSAGFNLHKGSKEPSPEFLTAQKRWYLKESINRVVRENPSEKDPEGTVVEEKLRESCREAMKRYDEWKPLIILNAY